MVLFFLGGESHIWGINTAIFIHGLKNGIGIFVLIATMLAELITIVSFSWHILSLKSGILLQTLLTVLLGVEHCVQRVVVLFLQMCNRIFLEPFLILRIVSHFTILAVVVLHFEQIKSLRARFGDNQSLAIGVLQESEAHLFFDILIS